MDFRQLNVDDYVRAKPMIGHGGRSRSLRFKSKEFKKPGAYFHPFLATLITGACAAEHQVIEHRLDWVFCDTDNVAIANTRKSPRRGVRSDRFEGSRVVRDLNPSAKMVDPQTGKSDFPPGRDGELKALDPPECFAVSAKRYVLFNRQNGSVVVQEPRARPRAIDRALQRTSRERRERIEQIGMPLSQEDL